MARPSTNYNDYDWPLFHKTVTDSLTTMAIAARYPGWHCASEPMSSPSLRVIARRVRVTVQVTARWLAVGN